jgi:hypothetical protein
MFVNCLTITALSYSGTLSDERSGLSFVSDSWHSGWLGVIQWKLALLYTPVIGYPTDSHENGE